MDTEALVWNINLACIGLLAFFVVIRLPQTIALFSLKEWSGSHFLRHVVRRPLLRRSVSSEIYSAYKYKDDKFTSSTDVHSIFLHSMDSLPEKGSASSLSLAAAPPTHIPATYFVKLRPILHPLRRRVMPGFSVSQTMFVLLYSLAMLYATFYRSNIFTDTTRTGWIATAQLPIVFAMAQKNSVIGGLLGYGYEKVRLSNKTSGRLYN